MALRDGDRVGRYDQSVGETTFQNKIRSISTFSVRATQIHSHYEKTHFNDMVGVERMYSAYAASTKEVDADTIDTTVETVVTAEFAFAFSEDSSTFKSDELIEVGFAFGLPLPQWIVLARE